MLVICESSFCLHVRSWPIFTNAACVGMLLPPTYRPSLVCPPRLATSMWTLTLKQAKSMAFSSAEAFQLDKHSRL